ncbi:2-dehydropantoate 2-reductase [Pyrenochaeta sp. DS3sAY3a]|nr:2-dehydropantoate 2-reductase [Pyrenochaeta sp. DS3sAY3a]
MSWNPPQPRVLLFGTGSVGAVYLYLLSKVSTTTAVCRSNYTVVKTHGFTINSAIFGTGLHFAPHVVRSCEEAAASLSNSNSSSSSPEDAIFDYILVCSKAIPGSIPAAIAPAVTPGRTTIVLVQNGIGIEVEYASAFPGTPIVSAVVYLPATQRPAGVIAHGEVERLQLGAYPSSADPGPAKAFAALLAAAGATAQFCDDVQAKRWVKLLVNAAWNPICALTLSRDTDVLGSCEEAVGVLRETMLEVTGVAAAYGYAISCEKVEYQLGRAQARVPLGAGIEPSMLQDVQQGRRIEVEAIVGNVVRLAKAKGVPCVRLEMLYVLAKTLDLQIGRR